MTKNHRVIVFDIDGTLTKGFSWQRFHEAAGITPIENLHWRKAYLGGQITYEEWLRLISQKYRANKVHRRHFRQTTANIQFQDGAQAIIRTLADRYPIALASSSPDIFVTAVAKELTLSRYYSACRFEFDADGYFRTIHFNEPDRQAKVTYLRQLVKEFRIKPEQIIYVGDSENDLDAFIFTGRGILVGAGNEALHKAAWKSVSTISSILSFF